MECYVDKWQHLKHLGLFIVLTLGAYAMSRMDDDLLRYFGYAGMVMFPLVSLVVLWQLRRSGPVVVISDEGIEDKRQIAGLIRWDEVTKISIVRAGKLGIRFLGIDVAEPELHRLSRPPLRLLSKRLADGIELPSIVIVLDSLKPGFDEVWDYLLTHQVEKVKE
ncbi:MAG: STM3941 family protein [Planctomycetota bacterium]|jgi:hypothetical protein